MVEKYQPLYLKYRPQSLADLVGQKAVAQTLTNAIDHDRICHAYLFTGPRGTGKTSSARILAKSLNCEKGPTATPCQVCTACVEIREGISPAVFELDAASNNSVDDARALIERAPLVAQGGRFKLYIIDECHMLTKEAFNALLKTIEEPPDKVIFILATTEEHKVPPTIISRCQRLMFRLVNQGELKEHLRNVAGKENINIEEDALELVARRSAGGLRDALGLLDQASLLSTQTKAVGVSDLLTLMGAVQEDVLLQISQGIKNTDGSTVLKSVQALLLDGREPAVVVQELAKHFLNLAKASYNNASKSTKNGDAPPEHSVEHSILGSALYLNGLAEQSKAFNPAEIAQIVELLDKLEQTVRRSSQGSLNLEMGLLSICHRHDILLLKEVSDRLTSVESALASNEPLALPSIKASGSPDKYAKPATAPTGSHISAPASTPEPIQTPVAPAPAHLAAPPPAPPRPEPPQVPQPIMGDDEEEEETLPPKPSSVATGDDDDIEPGYEGVAPPHPVHAKSEAPDAAPPPAPSFSVSDGDTIGAKELGVSLEEFWQDLKDTIQKRHMPTHAIIQTHAFILAFEKSDIVIGVRKENFQKMLEAKAEHIRNAAKVLLGREVTMRVKVVADSAPPPSPPRSNGGGPREPRSMANSAEEPDRPKANNRESSPNEQNSRTVQPAAANYAANRSSASSGANTPPANSQNAAGHSKVTTRMADELPSEGNLLKEAYKLFEGPGSRLIG